MELVGLRVRGEKAQLGQRREGKGFRERVMCPAEAPILPAPCGWPLHKAALGAAARALPCACRRPMWGDWFWGLSGEQAAGVLREQPPCGCIQHVGGPHRVLPWS